MRIVEIYTDGACSGNPGPGGWAAILSFMGNEKIVKGGELQTTNNRMELTAVIQGLQALKDNTQDVVCEIYTDSAYVYNAITQDWLTTWQLNNWKNANKKLVLNQDLWLTLIDELQKHKVNFHKVKGHADVEGNNRCDELARQEIQKLIVDVK